MGDSSLAVKISSYPSKLVTNTEYTFRFSSPLVADYWVSFCAKFKKDDGTTHTVDIIPTSNKKKNATSCTWTPLRGLFTSYLRNSSSVPITFELKSYYPTSGVVWTTVEVTSTLEADDWFIPTVDETKILASLVNPITIGGVSKGIGNVSGLDLQGTAGLNGTYQLKGGATLASYFWRIKDTSQNKVLRTGGGSGASGINRVINNVLPGIANEIYLSVTDSRGKTASATTDAYSFEFINYAPPSIYDEAAQRGTYDATNDTFTVDPDGVNVRVYKRISRDSNNLPTTITVVAKATGGGSTMTFQNISESSGANDWTVLKLGNYAAELPKTTGWELTFKALDEITGNYSTYGIAPLEKIVLLRSATFLINGCDGATGIAFGEAAEQGLFKITEDWRIKKKGVIEADFITENTTDSNGWTVIKTRLGLKIGIKSFEFTDVAFDSTSASGSIYRAIKLVDLPSGFVPTKIYATSDNNTRWIISAIFSSLTSKVSLTFGSGESTEVRSLKGDILIIGFETQGE